MEENNRIVLKSGKDVSLKRYHPWVFSGAIKKIYGNVNEGDPVDVYSNKDEFLGTGHYQNGSIAIRMISFEKIKLNESFWKEKIHNAYQYRKKLGITENENTNAYRLIHAEGDNIPGLIVDYYNGVIVMQIHSFGIYKIKHILVEILKELYNKKLSGIYDKSDSTLHSNTGIKIENSVLYGNVEDSIMIRENSLKFNINVKEGQKTGFFIDQRENRKALAKYTEGKNVLNMFCYTGGFSIYALYGNAKIVHSVDSSAKAIDIVEENIKLNFTENINHKSFATDAFSYLKDNKNYYDLIILDPPAFAKHQNVLQNALQGYKRLNAQAIEQIAPGGIIFTFSCSQVVTKENFKKSIFAASANTGRKVKILEQLSQPVDHPVNIYHPEGEYLKGLVLYVE